MQHFKLFFAIIIILIVGIACSTQSENNQNMASSENQGSPGVGPTATATLVAPATSPAHEDALGPEELPPLSFEEILETGIDSGEWTEGEGLVLLLRYFVGEIDANQVPGIEMVEERAGTGILRMAGEYLDSSESDEQSTEEITSLLNIIFPPQEVLDAISQQTSQAPAPKLAAQVKPKPVQQDQQACMDFAGTGYTGKIDLGVTCYYYVEQNFDGNIFRVYFPEWWQGDEEKEILVGNTMDALGDASTVYSGFNALTIKDVNLVFSILPEGTINGIQYYFDTDTQACPITMFPRAAQLLSLEQYKQVVAHEMFHCVQDWSFTNTKPYSTQKWWLEGTAHYYSNLVYPNANREWVNLERFDRRSTYTSIFGMTYENFAFFQFMGNKYSPEVLIDILDRVSVYGDHDGQKGALANVQGMEGNFNQFVVEYLSIGVLDSGGGRITTDPSRTTGIKSIKDKGEVQFTSNPFTAIRFYADYEKEKRFLQSPIEEGSGSFSSVEYDSRKDISAWSNLPPEVRSKCKEDVRYLFVVTTTDEGDYTHTANVTEAEKAECDPCLLGTWDIDPDSYAEYMERVMAQAGETMELGISGHLYIQFQTDGVVISQREELRMIFENQFSAVINGYGSGNYSADGEELGIYSFLDIINTVGLDYGNGQVTYLNDNNQSSFSIFGQTYAAPNVDGVDLNDGNTPADASGEYVCKQDTLTITVPEFGELRYIRVDKILPTPIPTPGTPDVVEP